MRRRVSHNSLNENVDLCTEQTPQCPHWARCFPLVPPNELGHETIEFQFGIEMLAVFLGLLESPDVTWLNCPLAEDWCWRFTIFDLASFELTRGLWALTCKETNLSHSERPPFMCPTTCVRAVKNLDECIVFPVQFQGEAHWPEEAVLEVRSSNLSLRRSGTRTPQRVFGSTCCGSDTQFLQIVALAAPETARSNPSRHVAQQLVNWFLLRHLNVLAMRDLWHHVNPVVHFIHNYVMDPLDKLQLWLAPDDSDALHDGLLDDLPPV